MQNPIGEYAKAGVNYKEIQPFKDAAVDVAKKTVTFPNARGVFIDPEFANAHGGVFQYRGRKKHGWSKTLEGLGNANWVSELLYAENPSGTSYHDIVAYNTAMMAVNDNIASGAMPVTYEDEACASDSKWFTDQKRDREFGEGLYDACRDAGMALIGGESPTYKYLINPRLPVKSAAVFGGCVLGIIAPYSRRIKPNLVGVGTRIIGVASNGIHANGYSLLIRRVMGDTDLKGLPDGFNTKLPSGMTIGQAANIKVVCYVKLIEDLLEKGVKIHGLLPGTGDGVAKLAFDKRDFRYRIYEKEWLKVPELFLYLRELGVTIEDLLTTFNWGVGYYIFVPKSEVERVLAIAESLGFEAREVGIVECGKRGTVFGPENNIWLPPPGE